MVKKEKIPVPKPSSTFYVVECTDCKTQKIIFSASTKTIKCPTCNSILCENTGGKARIVGTIVKRLDST
ncbi:MAG: 30S ribosomal protein S27e [Nitrososphaeria archaeon]